MSSELKSSKEYFWVIGGGILQVPLIKEANDLNLQTLVTDGNPNCECIGLCDLFFELDIFDIDGHIKLYEDRIKKLDINILGVLAAGIDAHQTMAYLNKYLKLPGVSPEVSNLVSNKDLFRDKMVELGLEVPAFASISRNDLPNLEKICKKIGFPLIIKNTSSSGSRGTKIFYESDPKEMERIALEAISVSRSKKALIESFWHGTEHTVETIFDINGKFHRCFITDRHFDKSNGYALETGLTHPSQLSLDDQESMYKLAENAARLFNINIGAAKFDMILTDSGPKIIEMTVRLSGGFDCQYLVPAATGKNILKTAILTAIGKPFKKQYLTDNLKRFAVSESIWPQKGKIKEISGLSKAKKIKGYENIFFRYDLGDVVEDYTDCTKRVCFIIASGDSINDARNAMSSIKNSVTILIED